MLQHAVLLLSLPSTFMACIAEFVAYFGLHHFPQAKTSLRTDYTCLNWLHLVLLLLRMACIACLQAVLTLSFHKLKHKPFFFQMEGIGVCRMRLAASARVVAACYVLWLVPVCLMNASSHHCSGEDPSTVVQLLWTRKFVCLRSSPHRFCSFYVSADLVSATFYTAQFALYMFHLMPCCMHFIQKWIKIAQDHRGVGQVIAPVVVFVCMIEC